MNALMNEVMNALMNEVMNALMNEVVNALMHAVNNALMNTLVNAMSLKWFWCLHAIPFILGEQNQISESVNSIRESCEEWSPRSCNATAFQIGNFAFTFTVSEWLDHI